MKPDSKIAFTNDVLKQVSKNLDVDIKSVKMVYDIMVKYLMFTVKETDAVSIKLPYVGTIYTNYFNSHRHKNSMIKRDKPKNIIKAAKDKLKKLNEFIEETMKKGKEESKYVRIYHRFHPRYQDKRFNDGKTMQEIEEIQNNR